MATLTRTRDLEQPPQDNNDVRFEDNDLAENIPAPFPNLAIRPNQQGGSIAKPTEDNVQSKTPKELQNTSDNRETIQPPLITNTAVDTIEESEAVSRSFNISIICISKSIG